MKELPDFFEALCPECYFKPEYPQSFKFDLIIYSKNYGKLEIRVDRGLELSEIKGDKTALEKLEQIGKLQVANKVGYCNLPEPIPVLISYPFKDAIELIVALREGIGFFETPEFKHFHEYMYKCYNPIDEEIFYEKMGVRITY